MPSRTNAFRGLLLAMLWAASSAQAFTVYCAGDANTINTALLHAQTASDITEVHIAQGVYDVSNTALTSGNARPYGLKLMGGYGPNCASRSLAPASATQGNTVLDGGGQAAFLDLLGSLTVEGLQFRNFSSGTGLGVHFVEEQATTVTIRYDIFSSTGLMLESSHGAPATLGVYNNLIDQSLSGRNGLLINSVNAADQVNIVGNTIGFTGNDGIYLCLNAANTGSNLYNNIVWANGGFDIDISCVSGPYSSTAVLVDNTYGTSFLTGASGSGGNSNADPLFVGGGNYRLKTAPLSPAINSGYSTAPGISGTDLDGNARIVGSAPDRGAYETAYDDTGNGQITVTNAGDSGPGTLRDAITQANAVAVQHYINFDIPGGCPQVITLSSPLPVIKYGVEINGYSQPGTSANTLSDGDNAVRCIVLNGGGTTSEGLVPVFSSGSWQLWVQGLVFEGFHDTSGSCGGAAIALGFDGTAGALIWGNQFGGNFGGAVLQPNDIDLTGGTNASIGGNSPQFRNIITGADCAGGLNGRGIYAAYGLFSNATGMKIVNNLIGTDGSEYGGGGASALYNDTGLWIETSGNTISGNVIVNAAGVSGVLLKGAQATGNVVDSNLIGITESVCVSYPFPLCLGGIAAGNTAGVRLQGSASGNAITHNTIWNNFSAGVFLETVSGNSPEQDVISANSIYANYAVYGGIYTGNPVNVQYNDAQASVQAQPDRGLNNPIITRAIGGVASGTVSGTLASTNAIYNIEVFASQQCDSYPGYGEGETFLAAQGTSISNAPIGNNGSTSFSIPISVGPGGNLAGQQITLTATDAAGNTSTFSKCMPYTCDVIFSHGYDSPTGEKCP